VSRQIGAEMRRRFLRLLNPLQVVELPRNSPEEALQLFAGVPSMQVLVVGGDGTVGASQPRAHPSLRAWTHEYE
jgi:hypothetical protein